jgi:hypothetical protein
VTLTAASLNKAKQVRRERQAALRRIRNGEVTLEATLRDPPEILLGADLYDVCRATPRFSRAGLRRLFTKTKVYPHTRLRDLTDTERKRLLQTLPLRTRAISKT